MAGKTPVKCPVCGRSSDFFSKPMGTFCSTRCKMVDLAKWLDEDYRIFEPLRADHFEEYGELEDGPDLDKPEE